MWVVGPLPRVGLGTVLVVTSLPQVLRELWAPSLSRTGYCCEPPPSNTVWGPSLSRTGYCLGGGPPPLGTAWVVGPLPRVGLGIVWVVGPLPQ